MGQQREQAMTLGAHHTPRAIWQPAVRVNGTVRRSWAAWTGSTEHSGTVWLMSLSLSFYKTAYPTVSLYQADCFLTQLINCRCPCRSLSEFDFHTIVSLLSLFLLSPSLSLSFLSQVFQVKPWSNWNLLDKTLCPTHTHIHTIFLCVEKKRQRQKNESVSDVMIWW